MTDAVRANPRFEFTQRPEDGKTAYLQVALGRIIVEITDRAKPHGGMLEHFAGGKPSGGAGAENEHGRLSRVVTPLAAVHNPQARQKSRQRERDNTPHRMRRNDRERQSRRGKPKDRQQKDTERHVGNGGDEHRRQHRLEFLDRRHAPRATIQAECGHDAKPQGHGQHEVKARCLTPARIDPFQPFEAQRPGNTPDGRQHHDIEHEQLVVRQPRCLAALGG
jgi:hypothetical protein